MKGMIKMSLYESGFFQEGNKFSIKYRDFILFLFLFDRLNNFIPIKNVHKS